MKQQVHVFAKPCTTICLDNTTESIQASQTESTGKNINNTQFKTKNQTLKLSFHLCLLVLLPFPLSLEQLELIENLLNNQVVLEAAELLTEGDLVTIICAGVAKLE